MFAEEGIWTVEEDEHVFETYRVRVCTRCHHAACPGCNGTWCDSCFDEDPCAEDHECVFEESDDQAMVLVRTEVKTQAEYEAAMRPDEEPGGSER